MSYVHDAIGGDVINIKNHISRYQCLVLYPTPNVLCPYQTTANKDEWKEIEYRENTVLENHLEVIRKSTSNHDSLFICSTLRSTPNSQNSVSNLLAIKMAYLYVAFYTLLPVHKILFSIWLKNADASTQTLFDRTDPPTD
jgi:hypothetical protein